MPGEVDKKYAGLLEKKWTSVIRLQKKVTSHKTFTVGRMLSLHSRIREIVSVRVAKLVASLIATAALCFRT
jgi:hypothetical protein